MSISDLALPRWRAGLGEAAWSQRLADALPFLPIAVTIVVMGIALWPELTVAVPSLNDDAAHYSLILNASRAIDAGQNPFDHWAPDLEIGYPQFAYYQHLPHLFVVALNRLLLRQVDLLTLFNLTRYVLMVGFPLTVYWSLRQLEFSRPAAAAAATLAPLVSANHRFGFEYDSYVWRGFGMYTQLWAMHLSFLSLALTHRSLRDGDGYFASVAVLSSLVLSHVIYGFVIALTLPMLMLAAMTRANARQRVGRLALVCLPALLVTSYFWLPYVVNGVYHATSPYMEDWKYNSFGASKVLGWLGTGDLFDHNRFPVITLAGGLGLLVALWTRTRMALFAVAVFGFWLLCYFGRPTWGGLSDLISLDGHLWMHRYIGPMQLGGLLLVAVAAGWVWERLHRFRRLPWPALAFTLLLLVVALPALGERWTYLDRNRRWMDDTSAALNADSDLASIIAELKTLPPGRVYAGQRDGWSDLIKDGSLRVPDILTFNQIETAAPPYQSLSLNSDLIWHFDYTDAANYDTLNARYLIAPADLTAPDFLSPLLRTDRYTLYEAPTSGYFGLGTTPLGFAGSQRDFFAPEFSWFNGRLPAAAVHPAFAFPGTPRLDGINYEPMVDATDDMRRLDAGPGADELGSIVSETDGSYGYSATVDVRQTATLFLKASYHPDWHVYVDGVEVEPFMVAPSFPAVQLQPGRHKVRFVYKPNALRMPLLALGVVTLGMVGVFDLKRDWLGRRFSRR